MISYALRVVGTLQIILGLAYLVAPAAFLHQMGHSDLPADLAYPLGMLAARFLVYGLGFWLISREPAQHRLWIQLMGLIQLIDLLVGVVLTVNGTITLGHSAIPMFNAVWIAALCLLWRPRSRREHA